jgi:hypothetical protein
MLLLAGLCAGLAGTASGAFYPVNATYNGLFCEADGWWEQSAGTLTIKSTSRGSFSAKLKIGRARYSFTGVFDANGHVVRDILRRYEYPLRVEFQVDPVDPDLITGTVSSETEYGPWTADLYADRAVFDGKTSVSYDTGRYTMVLLGDFTSTNTPGGHSYGTITVKKKGRLKFAGSLADGTKVSQSSTVSKDGLWPFYVSLYHGDGAIYSWIQLNGSVDEDVSGEVTWIRPEMPWAWYYPDGFAVILEAAGSSYVRPAKWTKVLDLTNAEIQFNGGDLYRSITNQVVLDSRNRITNLSANGLKMKISLSRGIFKGKVLDPITWEWIPFRGVVLQRFNLAAGYFLGWDESGEVWLEGE